MTEPQNSFESPTLPANTTASAERSPELHTVYAIWYGEDVGEPLDNLELEIPDLFTPGDPLSVPTFGAILEEEEGRRTLIAGELRVDKAHRGQGYGEKLTRALACVGVEKGCKTIEVELSHPASVRHFMKVFGAERMRFFGDSLENYRELLLSEEEAITKINHRRLGATVTLNGITEVNFQKMSGIRTEVDLTGLNTTGWDTPIAREFPTLEDYWASTNRYRSQPDPEVSAP